MVQAFREILTDDDCSFYDVLLVIPHDEAVVWYESSSRTRRGRGRSTITASTSAAATAPTRSVVVVLVLVILVVEYSVFFLLSER